MQNISQAANLPTPTPGTLSSLPLPSLVADQLAKFGLFASTADDLKNHLFGSSSFFSRSAWSAAVMGKAAVDAEQQQQQGWMNKQVLGSLLAMIATLLVLEQVSAYAYHLLSRPCFPLTDPGSTLDVNRPYTGTKRLTCPVPNGRSPSSASSRIRWTPGWRGTSDSGRAAN